MGLCDFPSLTFFYKNSESKKCKYNAADNCFCYKLGFFDHCLDKVYV